MEQDKLYRNVIIIISIAIPLVVTLLFFTKPPDIDLGINMTIFPKFHAILNSLTTLLLLSGLYFIKKKDILKHKSSMFGAFILSAVFLVSYVIYHSLTESTPYGGEGTIRYIYFFILITHIILAAGILPFILFTFYRALIKDFDKHKKIARWTLPLWLYVTITGVVVYFMIAPYY
ncbi:MAG: DUF420 domain-containing protein [Chitinophagaceae bacterium]|nr:MAG: DUF420 domain-containing protein [Chitinophagaceae bacterium]